MRQELSDHFDQMEETITTLRAKLEAVREVVGPVCGDDGAFCAGYNAMRKQILTILDNKEG